MIVMKNKKPFESLLETEMFGEGNRFYFVDLCMAQNSTTYLRITRSDRVLDKDGKIRNKKQVVRIFEEQMGILIEAMSMVFRRYNSR